jgi:two-component system, chemotaxis family, sensor kinase CheA
MDLSQYAELFLAESREHLSACNQLLLEWERNPAAPEPVGGIFRAVHTVKGMAATMGYAHVADVAHRMENLLDHLRRGGRPATDDVLQLLFRATDALEKAIGLSAGGKEREADVAGITAELDRAAQRLAPAVGTSPPRHTPVPPPSPPSPRSPAAPSAEVAAAVPSPVGARQVRLVLRPEAPLKGPRALIVLKRAEELGTVTQVQPPPTALEAEEFDGHFSFWLASPAPAERIVAILKAAGDVEDVAVGEEPVPLRVEPGAVATPLESGKGRHIRVDLRRLDALMDQIGELVTARGRLNLLAAERRDPAIDDLAISISRLSTDLQAEIIQARMTPVWQVFDRFPRLVRDVARELGKQVAFRVEGKEIELDRAILDELGDPLVHLLRNAVDHGIEPPAERRRRDKKPEGEIALIAVRERASVAISIADDGRGIDRARILAKAKAEGAVDPHIETLSDDQLLRVLARPGFSTAETVTNVSGRGVGIDVAMTRIRAMGGTIEIRTAVGKGTTFVLRLPVTLAIVRALITAVGPERYALPLTYVAETVEFGAAPMTTVEGREAIVLRDRVVPLVHLRQLLGVNGDQPPARRPVIVLEMGERRTGVVVDGMLGQQEIVVKGFDAPRGTLPVFSGATIMGDGVPALILDAGGLL